MKKINMKELISILWKDALGIIGLALLFGVSFWGYAKHKQSTYYVSTRNVLIGHTASRTQSRHPYSQTNSDLANLKTNADVIEDSIITDRVYSRLPKNMKHLMNQHTVNEAISTNVHDQSLVLSIKAHGTTASQSSKLVNLTADVAKKELPRVNPSVGSVTPLAKAKSEDARRVKTVSAKKYAFVGVAFGALIGMVLAFVINSWRRFV